MIEYFDFNKVDDFDKHIAMSIPNHNTLLNMVAEIVVCLSGKAGVHLDIGCSTGALVSALRGSGIRSSGVDISNLVDCENNHLFREDYLTFEIDKKVTIATAIFFFQFLRENDRKKAMGKMFSELEDKGTAIVCEKTVFDNPIVNNIIDTAHLICKREHFSDTEILDKRLRLARSMFLKTESELFKELSCFGDVSIFWKSYGFAGYIVTT